MVGVRLARPLCLGYFASCTRVAAKLRSHETQPAQDSTVVNDDASFSPEASAEDGRGTFLQGPWHDPNSFKSPHAFTDQENAFDNFGFNPRYSSGDYWEGYEQRKSFKDKQKKHRRFQERRRRAFEMAAILGDAGGPLPSEVAKTLMGDRVDGEYDEYPGCMCGYEYVRVKAPPFAFRAPSAIADSKAATRAYSNLLNYICGDQVVQVAYVARVLTEVQLFALGKTSPGDIFYADPWNQISDPIGINEKICHTPTRGAYEHGAETAAARVRGMTPEEREAEAVKIARAAYGWKFSGIHEEKGERNNTQQIRDFREGMKEYGDWVDGQMDKYIKRLVKRAQKEMEGRKTESVAPAKRTGESTEGEDEKPEKDKQEEQPNEASKSKKTKSDTDSDAGALFGGSAASASFLTTQLGGPKNWEDGKIPDEVSQQNTDLIELSLRAPPVEGFDWNQEKDSLQEDIEGIQKRHNETCTLDIFYMAILSRTMDLLQEFTLIPEDDKAHSRFQERDAGVAMTRQAKTMISANQMMKKLHESEANACGPESGCEGACWGAYYAGIGSAGRLKKYLKFEGTEKLQAKMIMKGMEEFDQKTKKRWRDGMEMFGLIMHAWLKPFTIERLIEPLRVRGSLEEEDEAYGDGTVSSRSLDDW